MFAPCSQGLELGFVVCGSDDGFGGGEDAAAVAVLAVGEEVHLSA